MKKENQLNENCSECNCVENATKGLDYFLSRDRTYYCISSLGSATDDNIIIPNCYNNLPVKRILDNAFNDCKNIRSIVIPDSVNYIDWSAFLDCNNLTRIVVDKNNKVYDSRNNCNAIIETATNTLMQGCSTTIIPDTVASIGCDAFNSRRNLTNIEIPNSVENIGVNAFNNCSSLTSIVIPNSIESIENNTFNNCSSLKSIVIPNSVESIGDCAFFDCSSLISIEIPNSVKSIGESAFVDCSSLTGIEIPDSVESIGCDAFEYCGNLTKIAVDENNKVYDSRNNCNALIETATNTLLRGCNITIIPNTITSIENYAFSGCSCLTTIDIPNSVRKIGGSAFEYCSSLTNIVIPNSIERIAGSTFFGCSSLISIDIPNSVKSVGNYAFYECSSLTNIVIPNSVKSIGEYVFSGCSSLTSIEIPKSVKSIGECAFNGCGSLTRIVVDGKNKVYDSRKNCNAIIVTKTNTLIQGCNATIIPDTVTSIGYRAFDGCSNLTSIEIPSSVTSIGEGVFLGCSNLTRIVVDEYNKVYDSRKNCNAIIETATNTLIQGCNTTIIPNTVTHIRNYAFESCGSLTSIVIPNSITFIGYNIFKDCSSLKTIFYEGSATDWNSVDKRYLGIENKYLAFYSETKPADNDYRYWHYVDSVPTLWNEK